MNPLLQPSSKHDALEVPTVLPLQAGDRLTRDEFERRYDATPGLKKAELIEGRVYMGPPVSHDYHSRPHGFLVTWFGTYFACTPGTDFSDNPTVRLDLDNTPQPDACLMILPECGGQSRRSDSYIENAPELVAEIAASSASYDLHEKLHVYRRSGVQEYIVWRVLDREIDWFVLNEGRYDRLAPANGQLRSRVFPGLWLDPAALLAGELKTVLQVVQQGCTSSEHATFVARLSEKRSKTA